MTYFHVVALILGLSMMVTAPLLYWNPLEAVIARFLLPPDRPKWYSIVTAALLLWVVWSWYQWVLVPTAFSFTVTIILTLGFAKSLLAYVKYNEYRSLVMALFSSEKLALHVIVGSYLVVGGGLLVLFFLKL